MNWIIKPNAWYDKVQEPQRVMLFLGTMIAILLGFHLLGLDWVGYIAWGLCGIYRALYFMIMGRTK